MLPSNESFYHNAIRNVFPDATDIRLPDVCGCVSPVFFCNASNKALVCKFNNPNILMRNALVSQVLNNHDIPAPRTAVHNHGTAWFESYDYCADRTLFEHVNANMSYADTIAAFENMLRLEHKMSMIDVHEFNPARYRYFYEVDRSNHRMVYHSSLALFYSSIVYLLGQYGKKRLYHNDMHSKNVLINGRSDISRVLDLDAVALGNETYCLTMLLRHYEGPESDYTHLLNFYEELTGHTTNRRTILNTLKLFAAVRNKKRALLDKNFALQR